MAPLQAGKVAKHQRFVNARRPRIIILSQTNSRNFCMWLSRTA